MEFKRKLPTAQTVKDIYPITAEMAARKKERDRILKDIFTGRDDRFVLVIGPCSADREDSVLEYISRLRKVQDDTRDKLIIVPRIYTNKPRTTGDGYKGMLHQPDPTSSPDSPAPTRCSTRKTTTTSPMCSPMWRWAPGPWRISSTA